MADIINVNPDDKQDNTNTDNNNNNDGVSFVNGKFKTIEDLEKAYIELQKKLGQNSSSTDNQQDIQNNNDNTDDVNNNKNKLQINPDAAKNAVDNAGLDFDELTQEFITNGELSTESREKLVKSGIPEPYIDAYIEGQALIIEKQQQEIFSITGNEEEYTKMISWASQNLSEGEIEAFNNAVASDLNTAKLAVQGLFTKYKTGNPNFIDGNPNSSISGFQSVAQVTAAMKDPRYKNDPAYRKEVQAKLSVSNVL